MDNKLAEFYRLNLQILDVSRFYWEQFIEVSVTILFAEMI